MVTFGQASATGLSAMMDGEVSHDSVTRFLSAGEYGSKELWEQVKPTVRKMESEEGVLIFDDTVQEKNWTKENELNCWHYDHSKGRNVKGINLLNCLYHVDGVSVPVAFELVRKPIQYCDVKKCRESRASEVTKNEQMRSMVENCIRNPLKFTWVLADIWFALTENMTYIKKKKQKEFIMGMKGNRLVALSGEEKKQGCYTRLDQLEWDEGQVVEGWLKGMDFPVKLLRQVFKNKDGSSGTLYLVCSRLDAGWDEITTTYQKRWHVEVFHKSLKSNAAFAKSSAYKPKTQANHLFASIVSVFKMEKLKISTGLNHFSLKAKLYMKAIKSAFEGLQMIRVA